MKKGYQEKIKAGNRELILKILASSSFTFTQLLEKTELSRPVLARHLKFMKKEGLLKKEPAEKDRRKIFYSLTGKGFSEKSLSLDFLGINVLVSLFGEKGERMSLELEEDLSVDSSDAEFRLFVRKLSRYFGVIPVYFLIKELESESSVSYRDIILKLLDRKIFVNYPIKEIKKVFKEINHREYGVLERVLEMEGFSD